ESAQRLAEYFESHPAIETTYYPGLGSHPTHEIAKRQLQHFGSVVAVRLADPSRTSKVVSSLRVARSSTSLGGPETLICQPSTSTHVSLTPEEQEACGITDGLLRISVGLEDTNDLVADFD